MCRRALAIVGLLALVTAVFASFTAPADAATRGGSVRWTARMVDPGQPVAARIKGSKGFTVSIYWGDGTKSSRGCPKVACAKSVRHVYAAAGTYKVVARSGGRVIGSHRLTVSARPVTTVDTPAWAVKMLDLVNDERAKVGAAPLTLCAPLVSAAEKYAELMADTDYYGHTGPDGRQPWDRGLAEGYRYTTYAENIAAGQRSVPEVMDDWIDSSGHYANIIDRDYTHAGFGHGTSDRATYSDYWVQNFGAGGKC